MVEHALSLLQHDKSVVQKDGIEETEFLKYQQVEYEGLTSSCAVNVSGNLEKEDGQRIRQPYLHKGPFSRL